MVVVALAAALLIAGLMAYLSDEEQNRNIHTVGHNTITPVEEFEPPDELTSDTVYKKSVRIFNEPDSVPCFIRVAVEFSDDDIRKKSGFTNGTNEDLDARTYYSAMQSDLAEDITKTEGEEGSETTTTLISKYSYLKHLPVDENGNAEWIYIPLDDSTDPDLGGYYYYTKIVDPNDYTSALFTSVRTYFGDNANIRPYDIFVYAESVQTVSIAGKEQEDGDWKEAWKEFIGNNVRRSSGDSETDPSGSDPTTDPEPSTEP